MKNRVIIVGGGLGGLSAAIHLAAAGKQVELFEKNDCLGGKMGEHRKAGYRFDTGPSLLTMPFVVDELFRIAGEQREDYLDLQTVEPLCRYFFSDASQLDTFNDGERMTDALEAFSSGSGKEYARFIRYSERIYRASAAVFLYSPFQEWRSLFHLSNIKSLFRLPQIDAMRTMHQAVSHYFKDQRLIQLFDRYATYNGSNPFRAPATLNIIPYVEFGLGGYYIRGGMFRLVNALHQLTKKLNIRLHLNEPVEKICLKQGKVQGVRAGKEFWPAAAVVCNSDVVETYRRLLPPEAPSRAKMDRLEPSLSGLVFLWGVKKKNSGLAHHNIFFSTDYRHEFEQIFSSKTVPEDPTIYIAITSKSDSGHAPPEGENWFVLLNMPYLTKRQNWPLEVDRLRKVVLQKLKRFGFDISAAIETETIHIPVDFYRRFGSNKGSIYGISSNSKMSAFLRPANRSRDFNGLYFASGSAHPGGGIPLVLLSGKMTAEIMLSQKHKYYSRVISQPILNSLDRTIPAKEEGYKIS